MSENNVKEKLLYQDVFRHLMERSYIWMLEKDYLQKITWWSGTVSILYID